MDVKILGPLRVGHDGQWFRLPGRRSQVILAALALEANRVVPVERLIDTVWESRPPSTARGQVQICLSALRRLFTERDLPSPFETHLSGYLLRVDDSNLDAVVFDRLVTQARCVADDGDVLTAVERLRTALSLWSGPALAGLSGRVVDAGRKRLEESRMTAIEERIRLDLALGHHDRVIGELLWLVERHRLRERLHALLMVALYRAGRQAEALTAYRAARDVLIDELGIEPGDELRRLERGILLGDPDPQLSLHRGTPRANGWPGPALPTPHQLPADVADFTGRQAELVAITTALTAGSPGGARAVPVVSIVGLAGMGTSALALHAAHRLLSAYPDGQLYAALDGGTGGPALVMKGFLRALGVDRADIPLELDEQVQLYRSRLAGQRILVVLDGVTDQTQIQPLLPGSGSCGVLVTSRFALGGLPGAHRVQPGPLEPGEALDLLGRIIGRERVAAEATAAAELVERCAGLPLAIRITGTRLAARPHWDLARMAQRMRDDARLLDELTHGPLSVRTSLSDSYRALPDGARRLLRRLALTDSQRAAAWVAAALLDTTPAVAEDLLEQLVDAQLVEAIRAPGEDRPRYWVPALVRVFARERAEAEDTAVVREESLRRVFATCLYLTGVADRHGSYDAIAASPTAVAEAVVSRLRADPVSWLRGELPTLMATVYQAARSGWDRPPQ